MKDEHLINYSLFCRRKKFSLHSFLFQNKEISYEEISEYFRNKKVTPPSRELFEKTKQKILDDLNSQTQIVVEEPQKVKEVKKSTTTKPKRKSRRRKNEQS